MTRTEFSVFALSPHRDSVWHYHDEAWIQVGGPAGQIYGGDWGLVATNPENGNIFRYLGSPNTWQHIGGPGASFAVTGDSVYGIGGDGVYRYDGHDTSWTKVGGPAGRIYGGDWGLVATNPENGNIFRYLGSPNAWQHIGGPGASFAVTRDSVYGIGGDGVYRYDGHDTSWTKVGGPAGQVYGGDWGLTATNPENGNLFGFQYVSPEDNPDITPGIWIPVGGPGAEFSVSFETIFGLSANPAGGGVYRWDGHDTSWTRIGGPADSIAAALWVN
ncbi:hypothetical protein ABT404_25735 [Streptomyces hyaluromycini]|uniref:Uncharacterized protein n=1 Tax=Streptomyces hyaluromycini TaxID=1377993 RepID=A0ABV1X1E7_9ACTN